VKSEGAIRHKIKQVRFRYLKRSIEESLVQRPENCGHNAPIDGSGDEPVRICFAQIDHVARRGVVCDERFGGCDRAASCSLFTPARTKDTVKAEFYRDLDAMSFPEIAYNYPDMAALLWVLADEGLDVPPPDPHEFDLHETVGTGIIGEHPVTASTDTGITAATSSDEPPAITDAGYRDPQPESSAKAPSWIDRLMGRVPS